MGYAVTPQQFYQAIDGPDWAPAFNRAITALVASPGGGRIEVPRGVYPTLSPITMQPGIQLVGEGIYSIIQVNHGGSGIQTLSPINGSTGVYTYIADLTVYTIAPWIGLGNGIVDVAGTYVQIERVSIANFKYGIVFDQTEIAKISASIFGACERGIWIVNGGEFTPGAMGGVSNNITVDGRNQFNACVYGIVDDGGGLHSFRDANFNACTTAAIYIAGLESGMIEGMEVEGCPVNIIFSHLTASGSSGPGQSTGVSVRNNFLNMQGGAPAIHIVSAASLFIYENIFSGGNIAVDGVNAAYRIDERGNTGYLVACLNQYPNHGYAESYAGATPALTNLQWVP